MPIKVIKHYGTKGMRWGVRKARRSLGKTSGTGGSKKRSVSGIIAKGKAAVGRMTSGALFKAVIFDKDRALITKAGRAKVAKQFKKNAAARYAKAEKKAAKKMKAKQQRAKATKKLIDNLISDDKASAKKWGKSFDEAGTRKYWEKLFEKELDVSEE